MAENFPNLKATDIKIEEAQRTSDKVNQNRLTLRHIRKWQILKIR